MKVYVKEVEYHGRELLRPNCETSRLWCDLLGRKSLSKGKLKCVAKYGYEVVIDTIEGRKEESKKKEQK